MNKYVYNVDGFRFMMTLSTCHFIFTAVCVRLMETQGYFERKEPEGGMSKVLPVAIGSLGSVAFMNLSLANNSVGFYQISKLACIPVTLFIQAKYFNTQHTDNVKMTLIPILFGVGLTTVTDFDVNLVGSCYAGVGVSFTVLGQVYTSTKQKELKMNSLQLLYHTAPLIAVGMAVMVPMFDSIAGPAGLSNFLSFDMTVGNYPKP
jgi:solute carrier family 35 protein E3